jgi:hypothetical protein
MELLLLLAQLLLACLALASRLLLHCLLRLPTTALVLLALDLQAINPAATLQTAAQPVLTYLGPHLPAAALQCS